MRELSLWAQGARDGSRHTFVKCTLARAGPVVTSLPINRAAKRVGDGRGRAGPVLGQTLIFVCHWLLVSQCE
jgi:hypothetical protein